MPAAQPGSSDETRRICRDESRGVQNTTVSRVATLPSRAAWSGHQRWTQRAALVTRVVGRNSTRWSPMLVSNGGGVR